MHRILVICLLILASCQVNYVPKHKRYKEKNYRRHDRVNPVYFTHQHVYVSMPDGSEVECIVRGRVSKKKYYVSQYKSRKKGKVHEKYMRAISDEELESLNKSD